MLWDDLYKIIEANPGIVQSGIIKQRGGAKDALVAMEKAGWISREPIANRTYRLYPEKGGQQVHGNKLRSRDYRAAVREKVKEIMSQEPQIGLHNLAKRTGYYSAASTFYHQFKRGEL